MVKQERVSTIINYHAPFDRSLNDCGLKNEFANCLSLPTFKFFFKGERDENVSTGSALAKRYMKNEEK